eukprot:GHVS01080709.1.p1 GENE.GHVS01080709.1~~GHVS01080709.1.p1  ORF type:complete len:515 (+),score=47.96 GHVS01080709.1:99-1643(+)
MNLTHLPLFVGLCVTAVVLQIRQWSSDNIEPANQYAFKSFQNKFLIVYLLAMFADWLQGPYVYALYAEYGFSIADIGTLFVAGFGCSGIMGCFIGSLADVMGRKLTCFLFCVIYGLSCVTKHFNDYWILMFGRLLGGCATSILFSVFDAWMVHEHHAKRFDANWLGQTFTRATFGNGLVAIVAGLAASFAAESFGKVAPFDASLLTLACCALVIMVTWGENYGTASAPNRTRAISAEEEEETEEFSISGPSDSATVPAAQGQVSIVGAISDSVGVMYNDSTVLWCGLVQSLFEGSMYTFVFVWTPALPSEINHGMIFASFMVAVMIGSAVFSELRRRRLSLPCILTGMCLVSALALFAAGLYTDPNYRIAAFVIFEIMCGVYFPAYYSLRADIVPDKGRATILNLYRVPMNAIVVVMCIKIDVWSLQFVFTICFAMVTAAAMLAYAIELRLAAKDKGAGGEDASSLRAKNIAMEEENSKGATEQCAILRAASEDRGGLIESGSAHSTGTVLPPV